jgi:endonuclease/exonuclease/phosphatase family metal-dependent hydrolase
VPLLTRGLLPRYLLQIEELSRNHSGVTTGEPFTDFSAQSNQGIEIGNQTAPHEKTGKPARLILASYNIRYGVGRFLISSGILRKAGLKIPRRRTSAIAQNLKTAAHAFSDNVLLPRPDILALQEADKETGRAGGHHIAAELAHDLGVPYAHVAAGIPRGVKPKQREWWLNFEEQIALYDPGDTGIALLSRVPLAEITRIDLPWHKCLWRPRLAMGARVRLGDSRFHIFNVHIDPHASLHSQHDQLEIVLRKADEHEDPSVILGDFNTLSKEKAVETRRFMEARGYITPFPNGTATWRGAGLRFHADWIFVRGLRVIRWGVAKPLNVSDHWPVWAEVSLPISDI